MNIYSPKDFALLVGVVAAGGFVGWLFGITGWGVAGGMGVWMFLQHAEYRRFIQWSMRPLSRPELKTDAWQNVADNLFQTVRRQRERTTRVLRRLRQVRAVTEALPDSAIMLDAAQRIDNFNPSAARTFGISQQDVGLPLAELVRNPKLVALLKNDSADTQTEIASPFEEGVLLDLRHVEVDPERSLVLARDTTQLNRLLSMRQDFVANVSHELRTPLTVILGYLETLQDEDLNLPEAQENLRRTVTKLVPPAQRMHALVQDLLLLTRLESSDEPGVDELAPIGMGAVFEQVIRAHESLVQPNLEIVKQTNSDARVLGIAGELESAVGNLLSNAIRYSPDGGEVVLSWEDTGDGARLEVRDSGTGIASAHLSRLTERFYRVDLARSRQDGGTGLGLAIVKHVLKRHNTALEVESELGKGSRFFCHFENAQLLRPETQSNN